MCVRAALPTLAAMPSHPAVSIPPPPRPVDPCLAQHKALRHALAAQLQGLGTLDTRDERQVQAELAGLQSLLDRLATHQRLETETLHPALEARQPGLSLRAAQAHLDAQAGTTALRALADQAAACSDPTSRAALLAGLYCAFTRFLAQQLRHMDHEEQVLAPQFEALLDDGERLVLQRQALASVPRWERLAGLLLLADALNPDELATVLREQREHSTPDAWLATVMAVQGRVSAARWTAIAARLDGPGRP